MSVIAVVGLGYVGLPLAAAFGRLLPTIGCDLSADKIRHCENHHDLSGAVTQDELQAAGKLRFATDTAALAEADFIVASRDVDRHMKRGVTIIYESTVYPGAIEEVHIPMLEQASGIGRKAGSGLAAWRP